jgi:hypothetical protein
MSFDPGTIALVAGSVKGFGSILGGESNAQAEEYNAAVAQQNAAIARQQGAVAADQQWRSAERTFGSIVASYGASGVQSDNGSPVDVLADSAARATLDNLTTKYNYELKAVGFENQAQLDKMKAQTSRTSGVLNGIASVGQGYAMSQMWGSGGLPGFGGTPIPGFGSEAGAGGVNGWAGADAAAEVSAEEAATAVVLA